MKKRKLTMALAWRKLTQHMFATKLRLCLFCLEYILFIPPPLRALDRDLKKVENFRATHLQNWALKTRKRIFS